MYMPYEHMISNEQKELHGAQVGITWPRRSHSMCCIIGAHVSFSFFLSHKLHLNGMARCHKGTTVY